METFMPLAALSHYFGCVLSLVFFVAALFVLLSGAVFVFAFVLGACTTEGAAAGCVVTGEAAGAGVGVASG
jgi:hypothetical protein